MLFYVWHSAYTIIDQLVRFGPLLSLQWYMVTLVHVYNRWKNSEMTCYVNGELASFGEIAWFVNTSDVSSDNFEPLFLIYNPQCKWTHKGHILNWVFEQIHMDNWLKEYMNILEMMVIFLFCEVCWKHW